MKAYYLHYTDNANSWNRILKLFSLYWPVLKPNLIIFAIYPFVACVFASAIKTGADVAIDILLNIAITANVCLCPIMLAKRDYRDLTTQLPARATEKLGFLLLTFWIIFPTIIYGSMYLGQLVGKAIFGIEIPIEFLCLPTGVDVLGKAMWSGNGLTSYSMVSILMIASIIVVNLYYVIRAEKNRTVSGVVSFMAMYMLTIILLILFTAVYSKFYSFPASEEANLVNSASAAKATLIVIEIIGLTHLILLYRRLRYSGF